MAQALVIIVTARPDRSPEHREDSSRIMGKCNVNVTSHLHCISGLPRLQDRSVFVESSHLSARLELDFNSQGFPALDHFLGLAPVPFSVETIQETSNG